MITKHQGIHSVNPRKRIPIIWIIFLLVLLVGTIPLHGQWESDGISLDPIGSPYCFKIVPDAEGGFWVAWSRWWMPWPPT